MRERTPGVGHSRLGGGPGDAGRATGRRIASVAVIQLVVRALNVGVGVVTVGVLARELGTANFGVWSAAFAYLGIFVVLLDFGVVQAGIQRMSAEPERESDWLGAVTSLRALSAVATTAVCVLGIPLFIDAGRDARLVALILSGTVLLSAPAGLLTVFQSRLRVEITMTVLTLQSLGTLLAVVLVATTGGDLLDFAWAFVVVAFVVALAQVFLARRYAKVRLRVGVGLWKPLLRVAVPLGIGAVLVGVYYRVGSVMLLNLEGAEQAGVYGAGFRLLDALHLLPAAVMSSVFPVIAAAQVHDEARMARLVQTGIESLAIVSLPLVAGSLLVADPVVELVFGSGFSDVAALLPPFAIAFVGIAFGYLGGYLVPVARIQGAYVAVAAAGVVLIVILNLILIQAHGALGASWATAATELATTVAVLWVALRALHVRPRVGRLARIAGAAALVGIALLATRSAGLVPALLAAGVVYAVGLRALGGVDTQQLSALLGRGPRPR